jgi:DNA-binding XRE family transcriptional regulator
MTQRALADAVGCTHGFIGQLESGQLTRCKDSTALRITEALGVPVTDLFVLDVPSSAGQKATVSMPGKSIKGGGQS